MVQWAGDVDAAAHPFDEDFVHIEDLGELGGDGLQTPFQFGVMQQFVAGLDGGRLAFDVGEDRGNFRDVLANLGLEHGHAVVGFFQAQAFVEFEMLFDVEMALEILHADVVQVEIVTGGDGADAIENIFRTQGAGHGVHDDVGIGQHFVDGAGYGFRHLLRALERDVAGHADGEVGEVAVAGAANAHAVYLEQAVHGRNRSNNLAAHSGGSGIEQGVDRLTGQTPAYIDHHAGHEKRGYGIGIAQPAHAVRPPNQHQQQADNHDPARPDVGGEMSASASSAWLSYLAAILPRARERQKSTAMEMNITAKAAMLGSISTWWKNSRLTAS